MALKKGLINGDFGQDDQTYDLSDGDTTLDFVGLNGFTNLSFMLDTSGLDAADATVQLEKTNTNPQSDKFLDIVGLIITLPSGDDINFIEVNNAKNENYRLVVIVNSVTTGTLNINLSASR